MFVIGWAGGAVGAVFFSTGGLVRAQGCSFLLSWCGSTCGSMTLQPAANSLYAADAVLAPSGIWPAMAHSLFSLGWDSGAVGAAAMAEGIAEKRMGNVADVRSEGRGLLDGEK